jgi:DUF4097 and DUF4098 domain-containing protein YvlB
MHQSTLTQRILTLGLLAAALLLSTALHARNINQTYPAQAGGGLQLDTDRGSIKIAMVYGELRANTSGGSIKATFGQQITQNAKLTTTARSVTAYLPADIQTTVAASTSGGRVRSDFAVDGEISKRRISGDINGGGPTLTLRTSGGSVSIKKQP